MKKYPSIEQFRSVIRKVKMQTDYQGNDDNGNPVYKNSEQYPTLSFLGTVKIHGTNAGVVKYYNGGLEFQSRERVLSLEQDNSGFMNCMVNLNWNKFLERFNFTNNVAVYGEWCGGKIQKGVAINGLEKMFVIFGIKIDDVWSDLPKDFHHNEIGIYNILQFPTYEIDIDFNNPELSQNKLINMTISVEENCPVGKFFGVNGIGEGIVFTCINNQDLKFKSKGEKHSASKVKVLNTVDVEELNSISEFVEMAVSQNRLEQGISFFKENNIENETKNTGEFIRWVVNDVLKEELDTIESNNLNEKKIKSAIANKARLWFINQI